MEAYDGLRFKYKLTCSSAEFYKDYMYKYLCITESGHLLKVGPELTIYTVKVIYSPVYGLILADCRLQRTTDYIWAKIAFWLA